MYAYKTEKGFKILSDLPNEFEFTVEGRMFNKGKEYLAFAPGMKTSNFKNLPAEIQKMVGFYPVREDRPNYDPQSQYLVASEPVLEGDTVVIYYRSVDIPSKELQIREQEKLDAIRSQKLNSMEGYYDSAMKTGYIVQGERYPVTGEGFVEILALSQFFQMNNKLPADSLFFIPDGISFPVFFSGLVNYRCGLQTAKLTHMKNINTIDNADALTAYNEKIGFV